MAFRLCSLAILLLLMTSSRALILALCLSISSVASLLALASPMMESVASSVFLPKAHMAVPTAVIRARSKPKGLAFVARLKAIWASFAERIPDAS